MSEKVDDTIRLRRDSLSKLLALIRLALRGGGDVPACLEHLETDAWRAIFQMAAEQGVSGVALEGVQRLPAEMRPERRLFIQWGLTMKKREQTYAKQLAAACRLADALHAEGIDTMVLKGIGLAQYYPVAEHRECNDIDLYLYGEHERGNAVAARLGGQVSGFSSKHDHILFDGFNIDNHITFLPVNSPKKRALNMALLGLLEGRERRCIEGTWLIMPPRDFNYVFLLRHAYGHFLIEGIALRHLLDFACFLHEEAEHIDWPVVDGVLKASGLKKFSQVVLRLTDHYFGLSVSDGQPLSPDLLRHIEEDMLLEDHRVVYDKTFMQRVRVTLKNRWKYAAFQKGGLAAHLWERFVKRRLGRSWRQDDAS